MWYLVDLLSSLILDASLAALLLTSATGLAMIGCRQPARRSHLAHAAIFSVLAVIPLRALVPSPRVELRGAGPGAGLVGYPFPALVDPPGPGSATVSKPFQPASSLTARTLASPWPGRLLTLIYLGGLTCGLGWLVLGCWILRGVLRRSFEPSAQVRGLYNSLPFVAGWPKPGLRVAGRIGRPVLVGFLRQTILIPINLDPPEDPSAGNDRAAALRLSLLHELAHAEEAHPSYRMAGSVAQAIWFFLPPLYWIRSQMRLDHELLADRRAAERFGALRAYASSLVDLASPPSAASPAVLVATEGKGLEGSASVLWYRVLMLVHCPFPVEPRPPDRWRWVLNSVIVLATLGATRITLHGAPSRGFLTPQASSTPKGTFRLARLDFEPEGSRPSRRARPVELPIRLPGCFDLTLEVWGTLGTLSSCCLVGHYLIALPASMPDGGDTEQWHRVRLSRDARGDSLWIDDRPASSTAVEPPAATPAYLSLIPPAGVPGQFRNLTLTW